MHLRPGAPCEFPCFGRGLEKRGNCGCVTGACRLLPPPQGIGEQGEDSSFIREWGGCLKSHRRHPPDVKEAEAY